MMVQKALSAKSLSDAQGATILTGWIKVLPMFLIIIPGMISRVLYPDTVCNKLELSKSSSLFVIVGWLCGPGCVPRIL